MKLSKKQLMIAALAMSVHFAAMADTKVRVTINGQAVEGKTLQRLSFSGDDALLEYSDRSKESISMELVKIFFADGTATGVRGVTVGDVTLSDGRLDLDGLADDAVVTVYDAAGRKKASVKAHGGKASVSTVNWSRGVYMAKIGNRIFKFSK